MATIQQKILFAAAFFRSLAYTNREALAKAGDIFGKDTEQVSDDLNAVEFYAENIVATALKHKVKPLHVSEMKAANVGDVLLIAATGKAAILIVGATGRDTELQQPVSLPFGQFADLLTDTAKYLGAYYTLTREPDTKGGGQCIAATFATEGKPGDELGIVYFNVLLAPTNDNITAIETAIKGL